MFCPSCGSHARDTDTFCRTCGTRVRDDAVPASPPAVTPPTQPVAQPVAPPAATPIASQPAATPAAQQPPLAQPAAAAPVTAEIQPVAPAAPAGGLLQPWQAYAGAMACGVTAASTALSWVGIPGLGSIDGFGVPLAALFTSGATPGGIGFGVLVLLLAGFGLVGCLLAPTMRIVSAGLLLAGATCTALMAFFLVRVTMLLEGVSFFDIMGVGVYLATIGAIATLVIGILLRRTT
ncbi:MAG: zinc-ribbon domain-containing protein [Actinomycetota bacterium]